MLRDSPFAILAKHKKQIPVDVDDIANDLGIHVQYEDLGSQISGKIEKDEKNRGFSGFRIFINSSHPRNRQRFTLAHEIAHYILHRDLIENGLVDDGMYRSSLSNSYETQANQMAADILMPKELVRKENKEISDPAELAKRFEVSVDAMKIRLENMDKTSNL